MRTREYDKLKVGDRVTVTGEQDGEIFDNHTGVLVADFHYPVYVEFDKFKYSKWGFDRAEVRNFNITVIPEAPKVETTVLPPKKKTPKGAQVYKGNGKHTWEKSTDNTYRLRVPGGWLYGTKTDFGIVVRGMTFVPVPTAVGYAV